MKSVFASAALLALLASPALAQTAEPAIAPVVSANAMLRAGTPISFKLLEEVTTKEKAARVGQRIQLEVAAPVELNGVNVIPAGTPAWGEITGVRNKGMWGKSGAIHLQVTSVTINGTKIRLKGDMDSRGDTGTAGVVGAIVILLYMPIFDLAGSLS